MLKEGGSIMRWFAAVFCEGRGRMTIERDKRFQLLVWKKGIWTCRNTSDCPAEMNEDIALEGDLLQP
jgi:hypothetical protein